MAKSTAERQREFRARLIQMENELSTGQFTPEYLRRSFADFIKNESPSYEESLDAFGITISGSSLTEEFQNFESEFHREQALTSLQRAIGMVGALKEAATEISGLIQRYKLAELERAIEQQQAAINDRSDLDTLKAAIDEIDRLKAIQSDLMKATRLDMPTIYSRREIKK